jgi:hypothetical protein
LIGGLAGFWERIVKRLEAALACGDGGRDVDFQSLRQRDERGKVFCEQFGEEGLRVAREEEEGSKVSK